MKKRPTQSRGGVKGGSPLRGQGAELPCGVWGNAPTVSRATNSKEEVNQGAGSEASLPVTLRFLRSAPKLLFPTSMLCRARWARPNCWSFRHSCAVNQECFFPNAGISPLRRRQGGFAVAPLTPSQCTPMLLGLDCYLGEQKVHKPKNFRQSSINMGAHRRFPKGDRRLRLFPLPFGRSRRSEIPANHYSRYCTAISSRIAADSMM